MSQIDHTPTDRSAPEASDASGPVRSADSTAPYRRISADGGDPHRQADEARDALTEANSGTEPRLMVHGNAVVRITEAGELESLSEDSMVDELSRVARFEKQSNDSVRPVEPPKRVAKILLDRDTKDLHGLPVVRRVTDVPVFVPGADGRPRLVAARGLDRESGVYFLPAPELEGLCPPEPESITTDDLDAALDVLVGPEGLLCDFGFDDEASRAHALALLLLPFVRELIDGPTPLCVVRAPAVGSAKSYLVQAALIPGCGSVEAGVGTDSSEEWRKRVTASLLAGDPVIFLDNLAGTLDSTAIAGALTTNTWKDRILGKSQNATLPIRSVWVTTGNNLSLSPELARRSYAVFLDPYDHPSGKKPADRERGAFRHPDLLGWAMANRAELVSAALTLIAHWSEGPAELEGGYIFHRTGEVPQESALTKGSFERWAGVVGGILESTGVSGFLRNEVKLRSEADDTTRSMAEFLAAWAEHLGGEPMEFKALLEECGRPQSPVRGALPIDLYGLSSEKLSVQLSTWLRDKQGDRSDEYELAKHEGRPVRWSVRPIPA